MKLLTIILSSFLLFSPFVRGGRNHVEFVAVYKWIVEPQSTLKIAGKSNINNFNCGIKTFLRADTLTYTITETGQKQAELNGKITIDIKQFDCVNRFITNDLRKTLKSDQHPFLVIRFISLDRIATGNLTKPIKGAVEIDLAGIVRQYNIDYSLQNQQSGQLMLEGKQVILFSDFKLKAPSRLAGLVKIEEEILVNFQLMLKPVKLVIKT